MSALLAVLAGTARLSRRDRAALTLALECARAGADTDALHALECADGGLSGAVHRALIRLIVPLWERAPATRAR